MPTDVPLEDEGYHLAVTQSPMTGTDRHWPAILSRASLEKQDDPHPAIIDGTTYWSSVLPWRTCGEEPPWVGATLADKMAAALGQLETAHPEGRLIWRGDWNQALVGKDYAGSTKGRQHLLTSIDRPKLRVPTAGLCHQLPHHASIDHIIVPQVDFATRVERLPAKHQGAALSDHDAYIVDVDPGAPLSA